LYRRHQEESPALGRAGEHVHQRRDTCLPALKCLLQRLKAGLAVQGCQGGLTPGSLECFNPQVAKKFGFGLPLDVIKGHQAGLLAQNIASAYAAVQGGIWRVGQGLIQHSQAQHLVCLPLQGLFQRRKKVLAGQSEAFTRLRVNIALCQLVNIGGAGQTCRQNR